MIKLDIDGKEIIKQTATPFMVFCISERNITLGKIISNGKEYIITVDENGKTKLTN